MRKYKTGSKWALWRWTDTDSEYLTRLHVLKTPLFAICVHWIHKPDPEPYLHDHPVSFLSLILKGEYEETRRRGAMPPRTEKRRWFNWVRASPEDRHTITKVEPGTVTLALMGPKTREWGFHRDDRFPSWVYWRDYYWEQRAEKKQREFFDSPEGKQAYEEFLVDGNRTEL